MRLLFVILQVALSAFKANPELAAGNLCGYFPQDTLVSSAPDGYKPFYISHVARHGSRYLSSDRYFAIVDTLAAFADAGMLTKGGLELLADLREMKSMSEGRYGDLTALGAAEHRQISSRMLRHYPEVFADRGRRRVDAYSTESKRVMASRSSFLSEMWRRVPEMEVFLYDAKNNPETWKDVRGYRRDSSEVERSEKAVNRMYEEAVQYYPKNDFKQFGKKVFRKPGNVRKETLKRVARYSYGALKTGRTTQPDKLASMGKYFSAKELYTLWLPGNYGWAKYLQLDDYDAVFTQCRGGGIIECILEDADKALAPDSHTAASLRFSHDSYLMPLMAAIGFEATVPGCSVKDVPERFQDYNFVCPACNVQLIFFRGPGPVLVKLLLNEKESLIAGLEPATGCFYEWEVLRAYLLSRTSKRG